MSFFQIQGFWGPLVDDYRVLEYKFSTSRKNIDPTHVELFSVV